MLTGRWIRFALLCCLGLFSPFQTPAQTTEIRLEQLDIQDAPPLATIDCMYEDSRGFLWLGSYSGLHVFDGYSMTSFYHNPKDSLTISDNKIKVLLEDEQGNFWVGTQVGLNYFDVRKKTFQRYKGKAKYGIGDVAIHDLKLDEKGNVWIGADDGLYRKEPGDLRLKKSFPADQEKAIAAPVFGVVPVAGGVYFCAPSGLFYLDFNTGKAAAIPAQLPLFAFSQNEDVALQQDRFGNIWLGSAKGLFYYQPFGNQTVIAHPSFKSEQVTFINQENDLGELWVGTSTGINAVNTLTLHCNKHVPISINGEKTETRGFKRGCYTASGIVWLSSMMRFLYKADQRKLQFGQVPIYLIENLHSVAGKLFELYEYSPGVLLIPEKNGPSLLNIHTRKTIPFPYRPTYNLSGWKGGVVCFLEENDDRLWIGAWGGLFLFDKKTLRFFDLEAWIPAFSKLRGVGIRKIHRDKKNNLWVATWYNGVFKIDLKTKVLAQYHHLEEDLAGKTAYMRFILETRNGEIWMGTRGGLLRYDEPRDSFQVYKSIPDQPESMSESTGFCLYEDAEGNIWCGTYGGGLNKLDVRTGKFKHYTTADGLLNNNVFSLLPDKNNNLWLLGYNGISKFNLSDHTFQVFTQQQGLLSKEYDAFLYGKSRYSNLLFFCGKNGIDYFDPDSIRLSDVKPRVWITDFKLFNESVPIAGSGRDTSGFALPEDISFTRRLTLRHDQNVLTFDYVALDFSSPRTIQYAYQLIGFDKDWQYVGNKRSVTFTNLDPGDYTFQVKASNGDGVWNSEVQSLRITVLTPWWRSWWFIALVFCAVSAFVVSFYRYRIGQIKQRESIRANLNQRIAEAKMEALRAQMNPHFIFNCLSSLKSYVEKNETEKASLHISKFSKLLRQVLDQAKSDFITLDAELDTLQRYVALEQMRYKNFNFQVEIAPDVPLQEIKIPPLIIQPFVENAIWHGLQYKTNGEGLLQLQVSMLHDKCQIVIEDNGIGRAASMEHKKKRMNLHQSHGLNVTAERIALFHLKYQNDARIDIIDLEDVEGKAAGTRVVLAFRSVFI